MAFPFVPVAYGAMALGQILQSLGVGGADYKYALSGQDLGRVIEEFRRISSSGNVPGFGKEQVGRRFGLARRQLAPAFERARKFALTGARQRLGNQPNIAGYLESVSQGQQTQQLGDIYSGFEIEDEQARRASLRDYLQGYLNLVQMGYSQPQVD